MPQSEIPARASQRVAFRGPIFDVTREAVHLASGHRVVYDVVRHRGSVVLIPQPTVRTIVLIRQFRWAIRQWIWELPAGSLEPGERPDRAARRECVEEIGLRPSQIERLGTYYPTPGFCDERMMFYRCTGLTRPVRQVAGDADEQIEPRTFTLTEVRRMIRRGAILDMKTICGVALLD